MRVTPHHPLGLPARKLRQREERCPALHVPARQVWRLCRRRHRKDSYASFLTKAGVPLQVVASALGYADARMTEKHYAHLAPSHVAQLIRDNLPQMGAPTPNKTKKVARLRG